MSSNRSAIEAVWIKSRSARSAIGGLSGAVAALIGITMVESLVMRVLLIGALTLVFMIILGFVYNTVLDGE